MIPTPTANSSVGFEKKSNLKENAQGAGAESSMGRAGGQTSASFVYTNTNRQIFSQEGRNRPQAKFCGIDNSMNAIGGYARSSTRGTENIFSESLVEQAQMKKPAFNTATFRMPSEATQAGFVSFNPGPGEYSARVNSIGSQFID